MGMWAGRSPHVVPRFLAVFLLASSSTAAVDVVSGAGAAGADPGTEVVSVSSFGARPGGHVDAAPSIERAIASLPATGGVVTIPFGVFLLGSAQGAAGTFPDGQPIRTAVLVSADHVTLRGAGSGTVLRVAARAKWRAITLTGGDDVVEDLTVDGNKKQRDGRVPYPGGDTVDALIMGWRADRPIVRNCTVKNGIEDGIGMWRSTDALVTHSKSVGNGTGAAGGSGIALSAGVDDRAVHDVSAHNSAAGIWVAFGGRGSAVDSNRVVGNAKAGISVSANGTDVVGNHVTANGADGFAGIVVTDGSRGVIRSNLLRDNARAGIQLGGPTGVHLLHWAVEDNRCTSAAQTATAGIEVFATARGVTLVGNRCRGREDGITSAIVVFPGAGVNSDWRAVNDA